MVRCYFTSQIVTKTTAMYVCATYPTSPYIYAIIYVHAVEVGIHHSKI